MDLDNGNNSMHLRGDSQPRVLAVDDDEDNLLLMTYVLTCIGCTFTTANSGEVVLPLTIGYQPDLILLDIVLPQVNGIEIMQMLQQDPQTAHIPIVVVTALALAEEKQQIIESGCQGYMSKPYLLKDLEEMICHYLQQPLIYAPRVG